MRTKRVTFMKIGFLLGIILAAVISVYEKFIGGFIFIAVLILLYVGLILGFTEDREKRGREIKFEVEKKKKSKFTSVDKKVVNMIKGSIKTSIRKYETDLDKVLDLVKKYKRLRLRDVAEGFGVSKEKIEEWGNMLAERNLLKLYYPTFGEPELRDVDFVVKQVPVEKKSKKRLVTNLAIVLGVVLVGIVIFSVLRGEKEFVPAKVVETNLFSAAFSGKGSYECDMKKGDLSMHYWIKDKKMKVATKTAGKTAISVFMDSSMYTYLTSKDQWVKVEIPEGSVVPGSGEVPEEKMICERSTVDDVKFKIPEDKIIVL